MQTDVALYDSEQRDEETQRMKQVLAAMNLDVEDIADDQMMCAPPPTCCSLLMHLNS